MVDKRELAYLAISKLKLRFKNKIDFDEYYLSYSGGNDSELLRYFIKEIMNYNIKIVSVNTYREHNEIRKRMYDYSDIVLKPVLNMEQIKAKYGIPCFTKMQDEIIDRYQKGSRAPYTMSRVTGTGSTMFKLNNKAKEMTLNETLHKVSNKCCKYTKKEPLRLFEKKTGLKAIIGVRGAESKSRKNAYQTCLSKKGKFSPMYDFTEAMVEAVYETYNIQKPNVYEQLDRTGCIGCPYGYHGKKLTVTELNMVTPAQRRYAIECFGDSYDVLGIDYNK